MTPVPTCPRCGSTNGTLGTSYAYFMCRDCAPDGGCVYWTPNHEHPNDWKVAIAASPWARAKERLAQVPPFTEPTVDECANLLASEFMDVTVAAGQPLTLSCPCGSTTFYAFPDGGNSFITECTRCGVRSEIAGRPGVTLSIHEVPDGSQV